ncbi:DUF817 domain-containing protein [Kangiella taiwanensis]|uniref:DUF817 domain-containing protein n=1 Tax=Kangiella taiwanensis TaxID=1079179 RepID=A0ABP8HZ69_9GAMM|nr:DUF817 domain-containing protein [Kangiella taiwanensis]
MTPYPSRFKTFIHEFWLFGLKQAYACVFGGFLLLVMVVTHYWYPIESLHRYDFIFIAAVAFQLVLLLFKLETLREAAIILLFHIVATVMELFKTSDAIQSWHYPEAFTFGIGNVPLFTGFMYSAVGSYLARVSRIFDFRYSHYPKISYTVILVLAVYLNFFSHHYIMDMRWVILLVTVMLFYKTQIHFKVIKTHRRMPLLLGWFLVALFIWFAENIATFANIWIYPNQTNGWKMVSLSKLTSWYLLMILSFVMVTLVQGIRYPATLKRLNHCQDHGT